MLVYMTCLVSDPTFILVVQGMDAESYSLHTFEALLTQSMENIGKTLMKYSDRYICTNESHEHDMAAPVVILLS